MSYRVIVRRLQQHYVFPTSGNDAPKCLHVDFPRVAICAYTLQAADFQLGNCACREKSGAYFPPPKCETSTPTKNGRTGNAKDAESNLSALLGAALRSDTDVLTGNIDTGPG